MRSLTATSYAVLGLLAVRARSAYELVGHIKRSNIRLIWPRAASKLYEEPKTLVAHGLATAGVARTGARRRTVYRITPRGRHALRRWLDEPGAALLLEFESMVKVVYGDFGTKEQLLTNIRRIRDGAAERAGASLPLVQELAGVGPRFPERAHVIAVADRFLVDVLQTTEGVGRERHRGRGDRGAGTSRVEGRVPCPSRTVSHSPSTVSATRDSPRSAMPS